MHREARSPAALTGVAGTAVLGTRLVLLGWSWAGIARLSIAAGFWLMLLMPVLRNWVTPTVGVSLVLTVSPESLAVLAATLAAREQTRWLLYAVFAPFLLGLAFYAFVISRFDLRQLVVGRGDHWITGGALAISTLAAGRITLAAKSLHTLTGLTGTLKVVSLALWALTIAWLPALLAAEALPPRLGYDVRRWSTVSPSGCTPPAASSSGPPRTLPRSRTSPASECGLARRCMACDVRGDALPRAVPRAARAPADQLGADRGACAQSASPTRLLLAAATSSSG